jgi:hypothetical protein
VARPKAGDPGYYGNRGYGMALLNNGGRYKTRPMLEQPVVPALLPDQLGAKQI